MNFGSFKNFQRATFLMDNKSQTRHEIEESSVERDLGVIINSKLKWGDQIDKMILTANGVFASLKNSFKYWTPANFRKLYTTFVRPHLEYCTPAWNPSLKKDISRLERVQRRATKIVPCLKNSSYSNWHHAIERLNSNVQDNERTKRRLSSCTKQYPRTRAIGRTVGKPETH